MTTVRHVSQCCSLCCRSIVAPSHSNNTRKICIWICAWNNYMSYTLVCVHFIVCSMYVSSCSTPSFSSPANSSPANSAIPFIPVAVETLGPINNACLEFLSDLGRRFLKRLTNTARAPSRSSFCLSWFKDSTRLLFKVLSPTRCPAPPMICAYACLYDVLDSIDTLFRRFKTTALQNGWGRIEKII